MMFSKEFKFGQIRKINDEFIMGIGDNPAYLDMILEKLITNMHKQRINELALSSKDNIYEYVSSKRFKETYTYIYNKLLKKMKNLNLNIIIYERLQRINNASMSQRYLVKIIFMNTCRIRGSKKPTRTYIAIY